MWVSRLWQATPAFNHLPAPSINPLYICFPVSSTLLPSVCISAYSLSSPFCLVWTGLPLYDLFCAQVKTFTLYIHTQLLWVVLCLPELLQYNLATKDFGRERCPSHHCRLRESSCMTMTRRWQTWLEVCKIFTCAETPSRLPWRSNSRHSLLKCSLSSAVLNLQGSVLGTPALPQCLISSWSQAMNHSSVLSKVWRRHGDLSLLSVPLLTDFWPPAFLLPHGTSLGSFHDNQQEGHWSGSQLSGTENLLSVRGSLFRVSTDSQHWGEFFRHYTLGQEAAKGLLALWQGKSQVADYAIHFRTLAADSERKTYSLSNTFLHDLSDDIKDQLSSIDLPFDSELCPCPKEWQSLLEVGRTPCRWAALALLLRNNSTDWRREGASTAATRVITWLCVKEKAKLNSEKEGYCWAEVLFNPLLILLVVHALDHPLFCWVLLQTQSLSLQMLGNHSETITLYNILSSQFPLVLVYMWLIKHNPQIYWSTGRVRWWNKMLSPVNFIHIVNHYRTYLRVL